MPTYSFSARCAMRAISRAVVAGPPAGDIAHAEASSRAADEESPAPSGRVLTRRPRNPLTGRPARAISRAVPAR